MRNSSSLLLSCVLLLLLLSSLTAVAASQDTSTWYRQVCHTDGKVYRMEEVDGERVITREDDDDDRDTRSRRQGQQDPRNNDGPRGQKRMLRPSQDGGIDGMDVSSRLETPPLLFSTFTGRGLQEVPVDNSEMDGTVKIRSAPMYLERCDCVNIGRRPTVSRGVYCPKSTFGDSEILCGIPSDFNEPVDCYDYSMQRIVARNSWPLVVLWFVGLVLICTCTMHGRSSLGYLHQICPFLCCQTREQQQARMEATLDRLQQQVNERRRDGTAPTIPGRWNVPMWQRAQLDMVVGTLSRRMPLVGRPGVWGTILNQVTSNDDDVPDHAKPRLMLKTKVYHSSKARRNGSSGEPSDQEDGVASNMPDHGACIATNPTSDTTSSEEQAHSDMENVDTTIGQTSPAIDDDDDESPTCAICFLPLEDGDRVGDLTCGHDFHVDCLKTWLPRRNTCPLCQARHVAQYHRSSQQQLD